MVDTRPPFFQELLHRPLASERLQELQSRLAHRGKSYSRPVARHVFAARNLKPQPFPEYAQRFLDALGCQSYMVDPQNTRHIIVLPPRLPSHAQYSRQPPPSQRHL